MLEHCVQALGVGELVNKILGGQTKLAVASTIFRLQIVIDIAFCYYHQRILRQGSVALYICVLTLLQSLDPTG